MTESLNRDLYEQLVQGIADGRRKSVEQVRALLDEGPFAPEAAHRAGLVDDLAYLDQLDDRVAVLKQTDGEDRTIDASLYQRVTPQSVGIRPTARVAVLNASGVIASGKSATIRSTAPSSARTRWSSKSGRSATTSRFEPS